MTVKEFGFVSDQAYREYKYLPSNVQREFGISLRAVQENKQPFLKVKNLKESVGVGAIELILNDGDAYRCVYVAKYENTVLVLHSFQKKRNDVDSKAMKTAGLRYKEMMKEIRKHKKKK